MRVVFSKINSIFRFYKNISLLIFIIFKNYEYRLQKKKEHFKMEVQNEKMQIIGGIFLCLVKVRLQKKN